MPSSLIVFFAICPTAFVVSSARLSECPDGWVFYPKSAKCFQAVCGSFTHDEAVAECVSRKAVLASVSSQAESNFIKEYIESATPTGTSTFWDGLQCRDGHSEWLDGSKTKLVPQNACWPNLGSCEVVFVGSGEIRYLGMPCSRRHGALCQRNAVASARVVDELETSLAHNGKRIKGLEDRVVAMEKAEACKHGDPHANVASTQYVAELEEALVRAQERIKGLERRMAETKKAEEEERKLGPFALFGITLSLVLMLPLLLLLERWLRQDESSAETATVDCTNEDENEHVAEEERPTDSDYEDSDDSSYGQLIAESLD